MLHTVYINCCN